jgi:hypothetical protein
MFIVIHELERTILEVREPFQFRNVIHIAPTAEGHWQSVPYSYTIKYIEVSLAPDRKEICVSRPSTTKRS